MTAQHQRRPHLKSTGPAGLPGLARLGLLAGFIISAVAISVAATPLAPTKGPIPDAAVRANGEIVDSLVPDFVSVWGHNEEIAGYVHKGLVIGDSDPALAPWPVYGEDLKTLVGHMVPDRGFVPLGVDEKSVLKFQVDVGQE